MTADLNPIKGQTVVALASRRGGKLCAVLDRINETVRRELVRYPRGPRGSVQNIFRAVYQMVRTSSLGQKEPWSGSADDCAASATMIVRQGHPTFAPLTCGLDQDEPFVPPTTAD